jgi:hypothetical protein
VVGFGQVSRFIGGEPGSIFPGKTRSLIGAANRYEPHRLVAEGAFRCGTPILCRLALPFLGQGRIGRQYAGRPTRGSALADFSTPLRAGRMECRLAAPAEDYLTPIELDQTRKPG